MAVLFTPACLQDGLKSLKTVEHSVTLLQVIHIWCLHGQLDTVYKHLWKINQMIKHQTPGASQLRECGRLQRCKAGSVTLAQYDDTGLKQHWGKNSNKTRCSQGQYRAAASQAKVATIPEGDLQAGSTTSLTPKASNNMLANQNARVHNNSSMVSGSPSYIPMGSRSSQRTPLATSSPSQIPTFQR